MIDIIRPSIELQQMGTDLAETWETPPKTSKCVRFTQETRGVNERERILPGLLKREVYPQKGGVSNPGFLNSTCTSD